MKTWYEVDGNGDSLLLLHAGLSTIDLWGEQRAALTATYRVYLPERRAYGHTPDVESALSYQDMADETIDSIESVIKRPVHLVGWSDGANVALVVASARPDLAGRSWKSGQMRNPCRRSAHSRNSQRTQTHPTCRFSRGCFGDLGA